MQQRISEWIKQFNIVFVPCAERPDKPTGEVVYRLKDLFTTCFGKWDPTNDMGSLPSGHHISTFAVWQAEPRNGNGGNGNGTHVELEALRRVAWQAHGLAYLGETAPVGSYSAGASTYGVLDNS